MSIRLLLKAVCLCLAGCVSQPDSTPVATDNPSSQRAPNFLILVADDLGVDNIGLYGSHPRNAKTPHIDSLASAGMRYTQFWSQPTCSPARASALTGRYSFRHGVGGPLWGQEDHLGVPMPKPPEGSPLELDYSPFGPIRPGVPSRFNMKDPKPGQAPVGPSVDELMLPAALKRLPTDYATAAFGKWHLADRNNGWLTHPNQVGFDHYSGPLAGAIESLYAWQHIENGEPSQRFGYVDQHSVDNAVAWIGAQTTSWFVWFSFINPHEPFHKPPAHLIHSEDLKALDPEGVTEDNVQTYFRAQVEAMDSLVGELMAGLPPRDRDNTYVIWLGDNGDDVWSREPHERKPNRFKITVYEGGVRVPFIVSGPGISGNTVNDAMAHVVDLFSTVLELAGSDPAAVVPDRILDSQSMAGQWLAREDAPTRTWNYTDINMGFGTPRISAIRNSEYKLISGGKEDQLFHLTTDSAEKRNLMGLEEPEVQANYQQLSEQLDRLLDLQESQ